MSNPVVHCIHDPSRKDRMYLLEKEIAEQGLNVRFWPAIYDPVMPFRGVSWAHKQIVRWAALSSEPEAIIMEDDCSFFAPGAFRYYLEQKPADYDLYLGNVFFGWQPGTNRINDFCGLTLYHVHSRFYNRFLYVNEMNHIDREMGKLDAVKIVCDPMVCSQHDGYSDNKKTFGRYEIYLKGCRLFGK